MFKCRVAGRPSLCGVQLERIKDLSRGQGQAAHELGFRFRFESVWGLFWFVSVNLDILHYDAGHQWT